MSGSSGAGGGRAALVANVTVKALLAAVIGFAAVQPDLPQFQDKAMLGRGIGYPVAALLVPVIWWLRGRRRPYPHLIDALLTAPFTIDCLGNAANLYDTVVWWDDANHAANWALLVAAICLALRRAGVTALQCAALGIGFGAVAAILWEAVEYIAFIRFSVELDTAYTDTLGDMLLGLSGSVVAAVVVLVVSRRRLGPVIGADGTA